MSNWFHRNSLKATAKVTFDLGGVAESISARGICSSAATLRASLLKLLSDSSVDPDTILAKTQQYVALILGFVNPPENSKDTENKLRCIITYKWSNSSELKTAPPVSEPDALFEVCSMLFTTALWLTKHAAKLSAKEDISQDEAKDVYNSLRNAAGIFALLRDQYVHNLLNIPKPGHDLCGDILETYINQSIAEAQEVTLARAIELKHDPGLIAGLAMATSSCYEKAGLGLKPYDPKVVGKWNKYTEFKRYCYETCAHIYFAEYLLKQEKAGPGLAVIKDAETAYKTAVEMGKAYKKADGVGLSAKPAEHCFFRRLGTVVENTKRKLERENTIIFHQRVPTAAPHFDLKATFGLVEPKAPELDLNPDPRWKDAYMGFNQTKLLEAIIARDSRSKDRKEKSERDAPVEAIHEQPIFNTDKDPNNESGCIMS